MCVYTYACYVFEYWAMPSAESSLMSTGTVTKYWMVLIVTRLSYGPSRTGYKTYDSVVACDTSC